MKDRNEHLEWCKDRALQLLDAADVQNAIMSMMSDLTKHDETQNHLGIELGTMLMMGGHLSTVEDVRGWIEGFN